jgi:hypothetical protein
MKIISGGQTGADRAALDVAMEKGIPHGGWVPKGRMAEDGAIPAYYRLTEMESESYPQRTEKNVLTGDGTLIISFGPLSGGSALTENLAFRHGRPCLVLDLEKTRAAEGAAAVENWLRQNRISVLNVAGPRASGEPRIYGAVKKLLLAVDWDALEKEYGSRTDA